MSSKESPSSTSHPPDESRLRASPGDGEPSPCVIGGDVTRDQFLVGGRWLACCAEHAHAWWESMEGQRARRIMDEQVLDVQNSVTTDRANARMLAALQDFITVRRTRS
jgi:hypothetical protein